jgi:RNA polymerase sigma-70 factor (ECF subfamily)
VDDLTQETLIRLWVHRRAYRPGRPVRPYLLGIAKNAYLTHCRQTVHETGAAERPATPDGLDALLLRDGWQVEGPESVLLARYREHRLAQAVASLAPGERLVFVLKHHEDLRYHEIASMLGIAEGTVKSRMFRAVRALRRALPDLEPGGPKEEC